ncbi:hypothetical protein JYU34_001799 [Plutella xylostella]|uniref:Protein MIS12 homolog n=1 Tax=Plutella xylostella TaxID=51655 RepID=A0ABQ7R4U8_PLUXY|nr:hypothetical protein JYU34_001799 [Plutella xylostella]
MITTKPWSGGTDEEYETQHFGFGAQRFKIAVRQMVQQKISTCVTDMQNYLQEALSLNDTDKVTLTHSCAKLIRLYSERAGPSLETIDQEIEKILGVPPNVLLPEDEVQKEQVSDEEYNKLKEEVSDLRKRVERGALMEALLTAEEDELISIEKACEAAKKDLEVLDVLHKSTANTDTVKEVVRETQGLCASVPFMRDSIEADVFGNTSRLSMGFKKDVFDN